LALAAIFLVCTQGALSGHRNTACFLSFCHPKNFLGAMESWSLERFWGLSRERVRRSNGRPFQRRQLYSGAILFAFTVAGLLFSLGISRVPAADPAKKVQRTFAD